MTERLSIFLPRLILSIREARDIFLKNASISFDKSLGRNHWELILGEILSVFDKLLEKLSSIKSLVAPLTELQQSNGHVGFSSLTDLPPPVKIEDHSLLQFFVDDSQNRVTFSKNPSPPAAIRKSRSTNEEPDDVLDVYDDALVGDERSNSLPSDEPRNNVDGGFHDSFPIVSEVYDEKEDDNDADETVIDVFDFHSSVNDGKPNTDEHSAKTRTTTKTTTKKKVEASPPKNKKHPRRRILIRRKNQCPNCPEKFSSHRQLVNHVGVAHIDVGGNDGTTTWKTFPCLHCNEWFVTKEERRDHISLVVGAEVTMCTHCLEVFSSSRALRKHAKKTHYDVVEDKISTSIVTTTTTPSTRPRHHGVEGVVAEEAVKERLEHAPEKERTSLECGGSQYLCSDCAETFPSEGALNDHEKRAHGKRKKKKKRTGTWPCPQCNERFPSRAAMKYHGKETHQRSSYDCNICGDSFSTPDELNRHDHLSAKDDGTLQCRLCEESLLNEADGLEHLKSFHFDSVSTCLYCGQTFKVKTESMSHFQSDHVVSINDGEVAIAFRCTICEDGKTFDRKQQLRRHFREIHDVKTFLCSICGAEFKHRHLLKDHMKAKHGQGGKFICEICKKEFGRLQTLKLHKSSVHEKKSWLCDFCGKKFSQKIQCQRHVRFLHKNDPNCGHTCHFCGERFLEKQQFMKHLTKHEGSGVEDRRDYTCEDCRKKFRTRRELSLHVGKIHDPNRKRTVQCNICAAMFFTERMLLGHQMRVHEQRRDFPCTFCPKKFQSAQHAKMHERTHTGERPFKCDYAGCGKAFGDCSNLRKHEITHTGIKPYNCECCKSGFMRKKQLQDHYQSSRCPSAPAE